MRIPEYLGKIKPGEAVLIDYTARSQAPLVFRAVLETFGVDGTLVIDIADIGVTFKKFIELAGSWNGGFSKVKVIKLGGRIKWGTPLGHYDIYTDPRIFVKKIGGLVENVAPREKVIVTLGTERIPIIHSGSRRVTLHLVECASAKLGDPSLIVLYFINGDVAEREFIGMMRDVATRVIRADEEGIKVIKAPTVEELGTLEP